MRPVRLILYCGAAVALSSIVNFGWPGLAVVHAQTSSSTCSAAPCDIPNLFDPDLADLKYLNNQALADATKAAADAAKNGGGKDSSCFPPPVTLTIFTTPRSDSTYGDIGTIIASARRTALVTYFENNGVPLTSIDPIAAPASGSNGPSSDGSVTMQLNTTDRNAPILKTNSTPPKGTKVKAGDQIKVHATASERYEDGHKSWPTGVKAIQLIADGTVVDSKDYGMKPPPCERRVFEPSYTVPSNPPPVVHLLVIAEDAVGHRTFEEADFPVENDWYGKLKGHGQGNVYNETAEVRFSFSEQADGSIKGGGHVIVTADKQNFADCVVWNTPPAPFDVSISGQHVGNEFHLELENPRKSIAFSNQCPHGGNPGGSRVTSAFLGPGVALPFLRPRVVAKDGSTNEFHTTVGAMKVDATIEVHQAKK